MTNGACGIESFCGIKWQCKQNVSFGRLPSGPLILQQQNEVSPTMRFILFTLASASLTLAALDVDLTSADSIKSAAKAIAENLMSYYKGDQPGQIPGILPGPPPGGDYYWWQGGALWGAMIDYWRQTGDTTWNDAIQQALLFQSEFSYMPKNWSISLGNDDQGFWGMSVLLAAENKFPDPPPDELQWLALAQAVFNTQAGADRHDKECGGGLRWQIPPSNRGYDYKNSIANGIFFNLGARLARYTNNATYYDWAVKTWDWETGVGLMDEAYNIYDGGHVQVNCTNIDRAQFSYNAAVFLQGAAFMYDHTNQSDLWRGRVQGLVNQTINIFFHDGPAVERSCETPEKVGCTTDMKSFKGYLHRWMANTAQLAPFVHDQIMETLRNSTAAAIKSCTDGVDNGNGVSTATCGFRWTTGEYDGDTGAGQQMNVLGALTSLLVDLQRDEISGPVTNSTGGTSVGDPNAGEEPDYMKPAPPPEAKDKAGAAIITSLMLIAMLGVLGWMNSNRFEG
ncbi:glycoside hydrolase family 76 protein [Diaporthe amygdali]|uniref:glycoside hydrolase family 76 protein n=1 Tax=Phomopsis amygdali TaxID=1214568 RepID=UPI0022FE39FC|nr:glycoside hydrolase family 76 protein [Diaporthe amygdali]KAJ0118825.1 glycoside hydrolase family 76 protein [Diaporthe amygdali]